VRPAPGAMLPLASLYAYVLPLEMAVTAEDGLHRRR
jgi:hypothetical protein